MTIKKTKLTVALATLAALQAGCDPWPTGAFAFKDIPAGSFTMGSPSTESCRGIDETQHKVTLTRGFQMSATEVPQGAFEELLGYNPSSFTDCGADCPVEQVSWHEAAAYCNALSDLDGRTPCYNCSGSGTNVTCQEHGAFTGSKLYQCPGYRLPTEAEWEYAYRAGTTTAFYNGAISSCFGSDDNAGKIGWYSSNAGGTTHPAGQKDPNAWGLHDMAGNVWEWCHDGYKQDLGSAPATDPVFAGSSRVLRGGSWYNNPLTLRAAFRLNNLTPSNRNYFAVGFRCSRTR